MLTPGRGYSASRLWTTEEGVRRHDASKDARHSRDAKPFSQQRGRHRGVTTDEISYETKGTVRIWYWDGSDYVDSEVDVEALCWFLNPSDTIPASTRVMIEFLADNTWEITNAWCDTIVAEE